MAYGHTVSVCACDRLGRLAMGVIIVMLLLTAGRVDAAGLLIADGGFGGVLKIKSQDVRITINSGIAVTEIDQVFVNTEPREVEALYTFPVPRGASVSNFSMWINGKEMVGEVIEKQRARQIYESYKRQRRDPGLLEQVDYKTFEMRVYPIPAGAEQRIRLAYYQELDFDHDWGTYVYPLATASGRSADERVTGQFSFNLRVFSTAPIVQMKSPSHPDDFAFATHSPRFREASLEVTGGDLSRDIVVAYQTAHPQTGVAAITSRPPGEDGYFMLTLAAGDDLEKDNSPMDYVFVLDVSGSMAYDGKLRLSNDSIQAFIDALGEQDRFEIMTFNVEPTLLFEKLTTASDDAKAKAGAFLTTREARGGTILAPAIHTAYRYADADRRLNVVILSDGMTEPGERAELVKLIGQRPANTIVFAVGVGNEVNRPLLSQLAEEAGGLAAFLSAGDNMQRRAAAFRRKLTRPALANVRLAFEGVDTYDVTPDKLPNLYHGAPLRIFGRYRGGGDAAAVTLSGDVNGRPVTRQTTVTFPPGDGGQPEIERMWAWRHVQALLRGPRGADDVRRIVELGESYSIVTPYTSMIVLENNAEYQRWKIERRNALRLQRDRERQAALNKELDRLRMLAQSDLGPRPAREADSQAADSKAKPRQPRSRSVPGVPEPSSAVLVLMGAAALLRRRRRP